MVKFWLWLNFGHGYVLVMVIFWSWLYFGHG